MPASMTQASRLVPVQGHLADPSALDRLLRPGCTVANLVYDSGATPEQNIAAADALAKACVQHGVKRMVHCSTAVVAGRAPGIRIDETTQSEPWLAYEKTKLAVEQVLRNRAAGVFELVILRPTSVVGPGSRNLCKMARTLTTASRLSSYVLSILNDRRRMNLVGLENVVAAMVFLLQTRSDVNQETFIISDDEAPHNNYRDVEVRLMKAFGLDDYVMPRIAVPANALDLILRMRGRSQLDPRTTYSCDKLLRAGFRKPKTFDESLTDFAEWFRNHEEGKTQV
jgi:nucleoside-diphosphate-sugar epimerase